LRALRGDDHLVDRDAVLFGDALVGRLRLLVGALALVHRVVEHLHELGARLGRHAARPDRGRLHLVPELRLRGGDVLRHLEFALAHDAVRVEHLADRVGELQIPARVSGELRAASTTGMMSR
jgi:hypothetical protein